MKKDRQFPWAPAQVFDDGAHVYLKLPPEAQHAEEPVLFVLQSDGSRILINYTVVGGDTYVTDRLFDRAVLVAGIDGQERAYSRAGGGGHRGRRDPAPAAGLGRTGHGRSGAAPSPSCRSPSSWDQISPTSSARWSWG